MDEIRLRNIFDEVIRFWPVMVVAGLMGAFLGYVLSQSMPPLYEAKAILSFGLNYDREPPLRQREQDLAEGKVAGFVASDEILQAALDELAGSDRQSSEKTLPTLEELKSQVQLVRKISHWELFVVNQNPGLAAELANAWSSSAERGLWDAYTHALRAETLQTQLDQIQIELVELEVNPYPSLDDEQSIKKLLVKTERLQSQLQNELDLSHGVVSFVSFEITNLASVPVDPSTRGVGSLVFAGNMLGFLAGIFLALVIRFLPKRSKG